MERIEGNSLRVRFILCQTAQQQRPGHLEYVARTRCASPGYVLKKKMPAGIRGGHFNVADQSTYSKSVSSTLTPCTPSGVYMTSTL